MSKKPSTPEPLVWLSLVSVTLSSQCALACADLLHRLVEQRELDDACGLHRLIGFQRDGLAGFQILREDRNLAVMLGGDLFYCLHC